MPTSLNIALFVLGGIFLLLALVGGRFKLFGAEIQDRAGMGARWIAGVLGVALILSAIWLSLPKANAGAETKDLKDSKDSSPLALPLPLQTTATYPDESVHAFINSCIQAGSTEGSCSCMLSELEQRYSYQEFAAVDMQMRAGSAAPQEFFQFMAAAKIHCAGR